MRKAWKALAVAGVATVTAQFGFIGALYAQTTGATSGATTGATTGRTTGVTTGGGGVAPTPIAVQPRFTG